MAMSPLPDESSQPKTFRLLKTKADKLERSVKDLVALSRRFLLVAVESFVGLENECLHCWGDWELLKAASAHLICHHV